MMRLSNLLNKSVLSLFKCELVGEINGIFLKEKCKSIAYLTVKRDAKSEDGATLIPFSEAMFGRDAVMVYDETAFIYTTDVDVSLFCMNPVGKGVYSKKGELSGIISDIIFSSNGNVKSVVADKTEIPISRIGEFGDYFLLKSGKSISASKKTMPAAQKDIKVEIINKQADKRPDFSNKSTDIGLEDIGVDDIGVDDIGVDDIEFSEISGDFAQNDISYPDKSESDAAATDIKPQDFGIFAENAVYGDTSRFKPISLNGGTDEPAFSMAAFENVAGNAARSVMFENNGHTPLRIISEYGFLLNRVLTADLKSFSGILIAPKGARVTDDMVNTARKYGKLTELTLLAKIDNK